VLTIIQQKVVDDTKLNQYHHGTITKSKREKEREAQEAKAKEEERLMAKAYNEFLETFEGSGASRSESGPGFVRSGDSHSNYSATPKIRGRGAMNSRAFEQEVHSFIEIDGGGANRM
jgi:U2-associated protein SR140